MIPRRGTPLMQQVQCAIFYSEYKFKGDNRPPYFFLHTRKRGFSVYNFHSLSSQSTLETSHVFRALTSATHCVSALACVRFSHLA